MWPTLLLIACHAAQPPAPAAPPTAPEPSACVATCEHDRMAEAVAWESIQASCEVYCATQTPAE